MPCVQSLGQDYENFVTELMERALEALREAATNGRQARSVRR